MRLVRIRRCVQCHEIRELTLEVVYALTQEGQTELRLEVGGEGEFAVLVDDRPVVDLLGEPLPSADEVVSAVREEVGANA